MDKIFSKSDIVAIHEKGIGVEDVLDQIEHFEKGFKPAVLSAAAVLKKGIVDISSNVDLLATHYDNSEVSSIKFVPASGAATRMFKKLFEFRAETKMKEDAYRKTIKEKGSIYHFFKQLDSFAFYEDLERAFSKAKNYPLREAQNREEFDNILEILLNEAGLDYGKLPKGLLKFHKYENEIRTPVQEHLAEGQRYSNTQNKIRIHFTVSPEHLKAFQNHIEAEVLSLKGNFEVGFSTQKSKTDTIAVNIDNTPFRTEGGDLLFRPAGHGALLENLNELNSDIVFVKNIDNVVPDRLKEETVLFKKALAGLLLQYQEKLVDLLLKKDAGEDITAGAIRLLAEMGSIGEFSKDEIVKKLNRPIRVCGMVKNEGEPGGGPFWVKGKTGSLSLQIVESAQVDMTDKAQVNIFKESTHFNPVDLVCGTKNYKGEKFDLLKYRDLEAGFISEKSSEGRKLKAMELPGLWNGSMADWNTIFVEVPSITFNPVKTVNDLLKENHH